MTDYQTFYLLRFMSEHALLAWCLAWPVAFIAIAFLLAVAEIVKMTIRLPYLFYIRTLRFLQVLVRGWPKTPNLDADGDIIHRRPTPGEKTVTVTTKHGNITESTSTTTVPSETAKAVKDAMASTVTGRR